MNILSDTGYCSRFLTDWAGPDAMVRRLAIRLGVPVFPGRPARLHGRGHRPVAEDGDGVVDEVGVPGRHRRSGTTSPARPRSSLPSTG